MTISIAHNEDTDQFDLMVSDGRMRAMPAGPRIFRAPPHPDVAFAHDTKKQAEGAADAVRKYLSTIKEPTKRQVRENFS